MEDATTRRRTMQATEDEAIAQAHELGREAAIAAASWATDGNSDLEAIRVTLAMMDDGDPAAFDRLPDMPTLSGEWSDDPTPASLCEDVGLAYPDDYINGNGPDVDLVDAVCNAWEASVSEFFEQACKENLRDAIA